jgi:hypothetical protein
MLGRWMLGLGCAAALACDEGEGDADGGRIDAQRPDGGSLDGSGRDGGSFDGAIGNDSGTMPGARAIGEWTDAPGECPDGATRVDIRTVQEMEDASRGDGPSGTCYFVHDGRYEQRGSTLPLYFLAGGSEGSPITWVGESRDGVVIAGRASFDASGSHVTLRNMTFDLTGFSGGGPFNTITVQASNVTLSHLTLTGDCETGSTGGHVEVEESEHVLVENSLIERFGQCEGDGHLDHGVYLASGSDLVVRNNVIRENASRGIQLNTEGGDFGALANVTIERNRIYDNGHRDYEDGIVVNGAGTGTIDGLVLRQNLVYRNYYSGIRFVGDVVSGVVIEHNTFSQNGAASGAGGRSEINLDDGSPEGSVRGNIFDVERTLVNTCAPGLAIDDNIVDGAAAGDCVSGVVALDPMFADAAGGDFHPGDPSAAGYGAYAR